jgi:hypothetical protein
VPLRMRGACLFVLNANGQHEFSAFALRRPRTIVAIIGGATVDLRQMPRDVYRSVEVPTIYVAQPFGGAGPRSNGSIPDLLLQI